MALLWWCWRRWPLCCASNADEIDPIVAAADVWNAWTVAVVAIPSSSDWTTTKTTAAAMCAAVIAPDRDEERAATVAAAAVVVALAAVVPNVHRQRWRTASDLVLLRCCAVDATNELLMLRLVSTPVSIARRLVLVSVSTGSFPVSVATALIGTVVVHAAAVDDGGGTVDDVAAGGVDCAVDGCDVAENVVAVANAAAADDSDAAAIGDDYDAAHR